MSNSILDDEKIFANDHYIKYYNDLEINKLMFEKYQYPEQFWDWRQLAASLMGNINNTDILDFGCGMGEESIYFAKLGANVTALDISDVGIEITNRRAFHNGLANSIRAVTCDVMHNDLPSEHFDIVHGMGILHHIGLKSGLIEIKRLLRKGGIGVFCEPMGNSKFIENIKPIIYGGKDKMDYTEHEKPLTIEDIISERDNFNEIKYFPYHITSRLRRFIPYKMHNIFYKFDYILLKYIPKLSHFAGGVVLFVKK